MRLLPSLYSNLISPVLTSGCPAGSGTGCPQLRGSLFDPTKSSTWKKTGQANGLVQGALVYTPQSSYGLDVIGNDGSFPKVGDRVIQAYDRNTSSVGTFGVNSTNINVTSLSQTPTSLLRSLKADQKIPSLSWAYTAGVLYPEPPLVGSLTLGGYDEARFNVTGDYFITNLGNDGQRNLLVPLSQISIDVPTASSLLTSTIEAYLDTTVPQFILPLVVCQAFERAFNLTWNANLQTYPVNDSHHKTLLALNPTITFSLDSVVSTNPSQKTLDIAMPYHSFNLQNKKNDGSDDERYFPLERAEIQEQYTLGRAFFQNAYVIVDYERASMKVYQALYPSSNNTESLTAIDPLNSQLSTPPTRQRFDHRYLALIVVGALLMICLPLFAWYFFRWGRKQKRRNQKDREEKVVNHKDDVGQTEVTVGSMQKEATALELPADVIIHAPYSPHDEKERDDTRLRELPAQEPVSEMQDSSTHIELEGSLVHPMMRPRKREP